MGTSFSLYQAILEHLQLSIISITISIIIGISLGILLKFVKPADKVLSVISVVQTIPTLAMLGFLVPILGIGKVPAIFVLIIYGAYPILINTYSGLQNIDSEYIEISEALGMNEREKLFKVKLPLSIPIIMAGIRTGLIQVIGVATLTSLIGAGGLGDFIYRGINSMNNSLILMGAIPISIIVIILSYILKKIENNWKLIFKYKRVIAISIVVILGGYIVLSSFNIGDKDRIVLSSKDYTESGLLTTIMAELIEEKTDIEVEKKLYLGTTDILHKALIKNEIDGYVEYTGTSYLTVFNQKDKIDNMNEYVDSEYDKLGINAFNSLGINNTFVLIQSETTEEKYGIEKISDINKYQDQLVLTSYAEFIEREDGLKDLTSTYSLNFSDIKQLERSLGYKALDENKVDIMVSFSTEPAIFKYNFKEIEDDKGLFMRYDAIPLINKKTLEKYPELEPLIASLEGKFDNTTMAMLNNEVENNKRSEVDVAREWLKSEGLID